MTTTQSSKTFSLVKYDTPILVSKAFGKSKAGANSNASSAATSASSNRSKDATSTMRTEDYLNSILPPREYQDGGQLWVQYVSPTPATRIDVINLQDELDKKLQERQARETGICPIREELYSQAFDELIRQVTINCAERGFLLVRVRDEIKMTIQAYQTLYESSVAYGMRKALQAEQRKSEMLIKINQLNDNCDELEQEVDDLKRRIQQLLKQEKKEKELGEKRHQDDMKSINDDNQLLKNQLKAMLTNVTH
ncbi:axonemal dynein light chain p33 [Stylonychia lemnae]|uniref:Axonemal dynein light chain p33 n=1 Tax=Stylonychia lemnae TaxID=5949 RepID=A0A078BAL9_STYLE|nr:axonemal dynein light chain p33 [Stylonychia lemnae]|eukprot:CDW91394.1 axonemal dynein light chain p33 [Stylonychia lemnae]